MTRARIIGVGAYAPKRVLTNADLEKMVATSDEWIVQRTGIRERRIADETEATSDLAIKAAQQALERANLVPEDIEFIAVGTTTPDMIFPSVGNIVQHRLGCRRAGSVDLMAACAGSVYSLTVGSQFIQTGKYKRVLCVGAETLSKITDFTDRGTCILLADAAGAVVLRPSDGEAGILDTDLYSDGRYGDLLIQPAGGSRHPGEEIVVRAADDDFDIRNVGDRAPGSALQVGLISRPGLVARNSEIDPNRRAKSGDVPGLSREWSYGPSLKPSGRCAPARSTQPPNNWPEHPFPGTPSRTACTSTRAGPAARSNVSATAPIDTP